MTYFGCTIGPVVRTILQARKTRELWAASFVFSYFMKNLLIELQKYGDLLSPINEDHPDTALHGAGIWPDRCFLCIPDAAKAQELKKHFPQLVENALKPIDEKLGKGQLEQLKKYFHCYACCFDERNDPFQPGKEKSETDLKKVHLFRLNKMLDDLEMTPKFQAESNFNLLEKLDKKIQGFYDEGFAEDDEALVRWEYFGKEEPRVRSLPEVALHELNSHKHYKAIVVENIEAGIRAYRENGGKEEEVAEEDMYKQLKSKIEKDLRARHRYVAFVHADGDRIGKTIESLQNDPAKIRAFSGELMKFSKEAVKMIHEFGGMPVYAGGDDLMFIAPLQKKKGKTIYHLLRDLRDDFAKRSVFDQNQATLSFGVSISYYKYPMAESLDASHDLLIYQAKKLCIDGKATKDAQAIRFLTHSGHMFETVLRQTGDAYDHWLKLFEHSTELEDAFLNGLMHKMDTLALWLFDACQRGALDAFFKAHFNEAVHSEKWTFIESVKKIAQALYVEYAFDRLAQAPARDQKAEEQLIKDKKQLGQMLQAMLRLVQFQNAPDHD